MQRQQRLAIVAAVVLAACSLNGGGVFAQGPCGHPGSGRIGPAAGWIVTAGRCASRGWAVGPVHGRCFRPVVPACSWGGWGWSRACGPRPLCAPAFGFGWPGCGFGGWVGSSTFFGSQTVSINTLPGCGATFFSGAYVPYVVPYAVPYAVPYPVPFAVPAPWFGAVGAPAAAPVVAAARQPAAPRLAATDRAAAPRPVAAAGRRRARELVVTGDRLLREAALDPARGRAAADAYRRAAAAAADDPDIHVRHALALVALGRHADARRAAAQAAAIDGRLAERPADPASGEPSPLVARGIAILRTIAAVEEGPLPAPLAELAAAWTGQGAGGVVRLAVADRGRPAP